MLLIQFPDWIGNWAQATPDKTAIVFNGGHRSYSELEDDIAGLASALQHDFGIGEGDRVAWLGNNSPRVIETLFACARIGAILVPLNWRLAVLKPGTGQADRSDNPVLILYTSGTTGQPKGVVLTKGALAWSARNSVAMHDLTADDRILMVLPMFHAGGFNIQTLSALSVGATIYLEEGFEPGNVLRKIEQSKPTLTGLVPAQIKAMVAHPGWTETDVSSLRSITTGSTFVPEACIDVWTERGVTALQVYGATETCAVAIHQTCENAAMTKGSVGFAAENCAVRLVGDGSHEVASGTHGVILIKGLNVFKEYWGNPSATAEALKDGWFHTGDIGYQRPDGSYVISGRQADLIISGGENIYPAELEVILNGHPEIVEAAVIGLVDDRWGEVPVAVVVKMKGSELDQETVQGLFKDKLARFKWPKRVIMVDGLPRNAMGKVRNSELRQLIGKHQEP